MNMNRNDVEKRWRDPAAFRAAVPYVVAVVVVAGLAFAATLLWHSRIAGVLVPAILFVGGVGALVQTYRVWRAEGTWPIWQGAGWFLLALMLFCLGVPVAVW
jgi:xanthine/uracil permease